MWTKKPTVVRHAGLDRVAVGGASPLQPELILDELVAVGVARLVEKVGEGTRAVGGRGVVVGHARVLGDVGGGVRARGVVIAVAVDALAPDLVALTGALELERVGARAVGSRRAHLRGRDNV